MQLVKASRETTNYQNRKRKEKELRIKTLIERNKSTCWKFNIKATLTIELNAETITNQLFKLASLNQGTLAK